jgi:HEAT repeat protein
MRRLSPWGFTVLGLGLIGCATHAAEARVTEAVARADYATAVQVYEHSGRDPGVLRAASQQLLLRAAASADPEQSRSAFTELSLLGTRERALLERLAEPSEPALVRARALSIRTALGDSGAKSELRELLTDHDAAVVDHAYVALEPDSDWPTLETALLDARPERRSVALRLTARAAPEHLAALSDVAKSDPLPSLRAAALQALERYGSAAAPAFEAATRDADADVRVAALTGYARVDPAAAEPLLDRQLGAAVSPESIAAAVALLRMSPQRQLERARAQLTAAVSTPEPGLRARAAGALLGLDVRHYDPAVLRARLPAEPVHSIRLTLALALGADDPVSQEALHALAQTSTLTGAEAMAELAPRDAKARKRLQGMIGHRDARVRATAARLLGRELHEYRSLAPLLADGDWRVRQAAASAVLIALAS